jgi:hypothetical protein
MGLDLHNLVSGAIGTINPNAVAELRLSTGYSIAADGTQTPAYATPGSLTGSISDDILTVSAVAAGKLMAGQMLADAGPVLQPRTVIVAQLTGDPGGVGTYQINPPQTVASEAMSTTFSVTAQIQDLTQRDLMHLSGLNIQGSQKTVYISGQMAGATRPAQKGGDLVVLGDGTVWLTTQVLESWPDWCRAAITLQND